MRPHNADAASFAVDRRQITLCLPSSSTSSMAPAPAASFVFNRVFDRQAKQTDVWSSLQAPLMRCFLRREHACLFAYGQTGSGKTHTMFGDPTSPSECGLAFRVWARLACVYFEKCEIAGEIQWSNKHPLPPPRPLAPVVEAFEHWSHCLYLVVEFPHLPGILDVQSSVVENLHVAADPLANYAEELRKA